MAFTAAGTPTWKNAYTGLADGAGGAIVLVDAANYSGAIGTIAQTTEWRADRQNPPAGKINLQIQKNGAANPSSIACCLVPANLDPGNIHAPGAAGIRATARARELTRAIQNGLVQSVRSRRMNPTAQRNQVLMEIQVYEVTGNFSN